MHEGKVKSVSRESVSETTDRVSREFMESKKIRDAYSRVDPVCIVGSIPCVVVRVRHPLTLSLIRRSLLGHDRCSSPLC